MNSFGYTESPLQGPGRRRRGHPAAQSVKKSPFYPDGYYLHRSFWIGSAKIIQSDPALVTAFVQAQQEAVAKLSTMDPGQVSQLAVKYWELPPELGAKVVEDDVLFKRGWCWPTEGDAAALLETSKSMVDGKLIPKPLTWGAGAGCVRARPRPPVKAAYDKTGAKPELAAFDGEERRRPARHCRSG